jgi:hypothetical protein
MSQAEGTSAAMSRSRGAVVRPQERTEALAALLAIDGLRLGYALDQSVAQAQVVALQMIVGRELFDDVPQVALADRHDRRQALVLDRPDESFGVGVEVGALRREHDRLDSGRAQQRRKISAEERVAIVDQVAVLKQEAVEAIDERSGDSGLLAEVLDRPLLPLVEPAREA